MSPRSNIWILLADIWLQCFHKTVWRGHQTSCFYWRLSYSLLYSFIFTCFTPLSNSTELTSTSKHRLIKYIVILHWIHVIGSGIPTTEIPGRWPELLGGPSVPGCELNSLRLSPANTNRCLHSLWPVSTVKERAGRTPTPAHRQCTGGRWLRVEALFKAQMSAAHTRLPSCRPTARLRIRCIRARRMQRYTAAKHRHSCRGYPTLHNSPHVVPRILMVNTTHTHVCCFQVRLGM